MSLTGLTPQTVVKRSPDIAQRLFEERVLVITVRDSRLHRLNASGTYIWLALENPATVADISSRMSAYFDECTEEQAQQDTLAFLEKLVEKGLILIEKPGA